MNKNRYKFRGMAEGKNGFKTEKRWVYGSLLWWAGNPQIWTDDGCNFMVIPESVSQFTGLHDKNGKEAYFDDTVRFPYSLPPFDGTNIEWHTGVIGMNEYGHSCIMVGDSKFHIQGVLKGEVVGNIHDNKLKSL